MKNEEKQTGFIHTAGLQTREGALCYRRDFASMSADDPIPRCRRHWRHRIWMKRPARLNSKSSRFTRPTNHQPARGVSRILMGLVCASVPIVLRPIGGRTPSRLLFCGRRSKINAVEARARPHMLKPVQRAVSDALVREQVLQPSAMTALRRGDSLPTVRFISRLPRGRHNVRAPQSTHRHSDLPAHHSLRRTVQGNDRQPKEQRSQVTSNLVVLNPGSLCENRSHQRGTPAVSFLDYSCYLYMFYLSHLSYLTRQSLRA